MHNAEASRNICGDHSQTLHDPTIMSRHQGAKKDYNLAILHQLYIISLVIKTPLHNYMLTTLLSLNTMIVLLERLIALLEYLDPCSNKVQLTIKIDCSMCIQ